ncbi:MAG: outer membrane beta-barrel protein [Deltaproteobacteria bacterium]|nr:outer membrane beta-barrel protein [Deltaproteobacteria bacterium]
MRKLIIVALVLSVGFIASNVSAQERYVGGGFEAAGHVVTGMGYQHNNNRANTEFARDGDTLTYAGPIGKYVGTAPNNRTDHFSFFVDEVELDLMKSFGENVRLRADLDFARVNSTGIGTAAFVLEQAYATANIPLGNGIEFLMGRFNAPMGFESVDVADNDLVSKTILVRALRPANLTGAKIYYAFSDFVDIHLYSVNTLTQDTLVKINDMPSWGMRLGFNWGSEGTESTFGVSGFFGPETRVSNKHFTFGGDLDLSWWATESFNVGFEGLFRRDDATTQTFGVLPGSNTEYMAALLNLHYVFSDVWDGTLRGTYAKQFDPGNGGTAAVGDRAWQNLTGAEQTIMEIALGGAYSVADGAKFKIEGRFDIVNPTGASNTEYTYGAVMAFVYDF